MSAPKRAEWSDRSGLVELDWGRVFLRDVGPTSGPRPPVLLVHGLFVTHYEFRRVIPLLADDRRVLALDLPGAGESDRPAPDGDTYGLPWLARALQAVLDAVGVDTVDVVAHSFGGAVSLHFARQWPARVRRLVLVDPVCLSIDIPADGRLALLPGVGRFLFRRLYRRAELRRHMERAFSTPELLEDSALDLYWDRLARRGGREAAYEMFRELTRLDRMRDVLCAVECPTLVVWGDRDHIVPVETADEVVDLLPNAELQVIKGCGHAANEERPEALVALVRGHLDRP